MSRAFTKLFSSITESTVWCEPDRTRIVWICMLAKADQHGEVHASIPGLANCARVPVEDCKTAIDTFLAPDEYSRTADNEGRRIEVIDGGWRLLNYQKYRDSRDEEKTRESKRRYMEKRRASLKSGNSGTKVEQSGTRVEGSGTEWNQAEAEADKEEIQGRATTSLEAVAPNPSFEPAQLPDLKGHTPTPFGLVCRSMKAKGLSAVNPGDPRLIALVQQGATVVEFEGIAAEAVEKGKGWAWVLAVLQARRTEAASIALAPMTGNKSAPVSDNARAMLAESERFAGSMEAHRALANSPAAIAARAAALAAMKVVKA